MSGEFIDSNVFVYMFDNTNQQKRLRAKSLVSDHIRDASGVISFQVVQEVLNVLTTKMARPVRHEDARAFLAAVLRPLWKVYPNEELYRSALGVQERYRYSFSDSLIITAAAQSGCRTLISEDLQAGQVIDGVRVVDPFA